MKNVRNFAAYSILLLVAGMLIYGLIPSKVHFDDQAIKISGMYGVEIKLSEIDKVELTNNRPVTTSRTNGLGLGSIKKGDFQVEEYGKSRLLVHSNEPPYLIISQKGGKTTFVNFGDKTETESTFMQLKKLVD